MSAFNEEPLPEALNTPLQDDIATLLSGDQTEETRVLCALIVEIIRKRSHYRTCSRYRDLIGPSDLEDLSSEIMVVLLSGTLQMFRGGTHGELVCFLRTIVDRHLWRMVQHRLRKRTPPLARASRSGPTA